MKNKVLNSVVMDVGISEQLPLLTKTKKDKVSPQMSPDIKRINVRSQSNHNFASPVSLNINTTLINLNPSLDDDKQSDAKSISTLSSVQSHNSCDKNGRARRSDNSHSPSPSTSLERTRASNVRKILPKNPLLQCRTILQLLLHVMHMSDTKEIMINELKNSQWFAKFLPSLTDASTDVSKQIFKCIHQIDILRHKGIKKSALLAQKIKSVRNKYKLRHIQLVTGISYSNVQRLLNAGKAKKCKRKITEQDRMSIAHFVLQTVHSMQIPYRWFAK